jgi:glycosyltransferase involved in cell wall biosynthesis
MVATYMRICRMKVLYVSPYPPAQDGIGDYTRLLVAAGRQQGHDVRVVVPRLTPHAHPDVIGAVGSRGRESAELREAIAKWDPDVVHVQFAIAAYGTQTVALLRWLDALRRDLAVPVVGTLHEVTRETALLRAAGRKFYREIVARCEHVIVHTHVAHNALTGPVGVAESKVVVIPHPRARPPDGTSTPEDVRRRFGLGEARILLAFGFIHVDKGLDDLVGALSILRRTSAAPLDDVRVVVAGTVRPRHGLFRVFEVRDRLHLARILRQARRKSLQQYLVLTGYVPADEISAWFHAAEAVVLPYRRTEQSGVASLASAFGVPVIASAVGGLREQFAGSRWTFPAHAPEFLARVLIEFLSATPSEQARLVRPPHATDLASVITATFQLYGRVTTDHARAVAALP